MQKKVNSDVTFTGDALSHFDLIKKETASVSLLPHLVPDAQLSLALDESDSAVGAAL